MVSDSLVLGGSFETGITNECSTDKNFLAYEGFAYQETVKLPKNYCTTLVSDWLFPELVISRQLMNSSKIFQSRVPHEHGSCSG